jgi:citrate synthase
MAGFLTEAAARLGVTRATLYAYVSRGLIRACEADDPRRRLYAADAVERLAVERRRGRRSKEVAKMALDFGAPVLESAITLIRDGRLWRRRPSFTVRCVASTGASLHAAVVVGQAALSGPRHGGVTERVESLFDAAEADGAAVALRRRLAAGEDLPGFGHPLYPNGDPRAAALLAEVADPLSAALTGEAERLTGLAPSLDFGLVAIRRALRLPRGAAFALFAVGRAVGWIAHALEQRKPGILIRPRAVYVGNGPGEGAFTSAAPA